jgi:platelet-activating factor acetylhydrolase IB subunit alpha
MMRICNKTLKHRRLSILDYLASSGLKETYNTFIEETKIPTRPTEKHRGSLEKRWTSIIRLQKRIIQLEGELAEYRTGSSGKKSMNSYGYPQQPERYNLIGHHKPIICVDFHPILPIVASGDEGGIIKIWMLESGELEKSLSGHIKSVNGLCFKKDGDLLISCSSDMTIKFWNTVQGYVCVKTLQGHENTISSICPIPKTEYFVSVSRDETIKVWDIQSGFCVKTMTGHTDWIRSVACSEDGSILATCGNEKSIFLWNTSNWTFAGELRGHDHVIQGVSFPPIKSMKRLNTLLAKSANSTTSTNFLFSCSRDKTIKIWDLNSLECLHTFVFSS